MLEPGYEELPTHMGTPPSSFPSPQLPNKPFPLLTTPSMLGWFKSLFLYKNTALIRLHVTSAWSTKMADSGKTKSSREKVRRHRERLRRQGLRPIQIWVPDVRAPSFRSQAHFQSLAVAESAMAEEDQGFIDSVSELDQV